LDERIYNENLEHISFKNKEIEKKNEIDKLS